MNQWRASFRCLTFGTAFLLAECASEKAQISPEAASGLTQVRAQAVQIKQQLTRTNESARTLSKSSGSELPKSLDAVSANLDSLDSTVGVTRQAVRSVQEQVAAYFYNWDKETRAMSDEMQKTSQKRQAEAAASFQALRDSIGEVRSGLSQYMSEMSEIVTYLRTDLTEAGLHAVSSRLSDTMAGEPTIQRNLDAVISKIDAIQSTKK
jgi:hypothetical protein